MGPPPGREHRAGRGDAAHGPRHRQLRLLLQGAHPWRCQVHKWVEPCLSADGRTACLLQFLLGFSMSRGGWQLRARRGYSSIPWQAQSFSLTAPHVLAHHCMKGAPLQVDGKPVEEEPLQARSRPAAPAGPVAVPRQSRSARSAPTAVAAQVCARRAVRALEVQQLGT